jgi:hypothetical protein
MAVTTKTGETDVKYMQDGIEKVEKVAYSAQVASDLEGAMELADKTIAAVGEKEGDTDVTADNRQDLMVAWILSRFNQVMESNARQAARAAFLNTIAGPDKAIASMAKKLAALKGISQADAEAQIRKNFGF